MEIIAGLAAVILLIWICSSSGGKTITPKYRIEATADDRYYEVIDRNGESRYIGTYNACELWIKEHDA